MEPHNPIIQTDSIVKVVDLTRKFGDFIATDKISFNVKPGEIFGFLGPNGAGKSTTIRMLCGLLKPTSGQGSVMGFDIYTQQEEIKQNIGYMSQKFSLYTDLSVEENINFFGGIYGLNSRELKERKEWAIEMAGLKKHRNAMCSVLAGGWKQRLALGCAVLHQPKMIFLDEPTSGVDPQSRRMFWDLIYDMSSKGVTIFVTTHYLDEAEYCDRVGLIYRGALIALGSPLEMKTEYMKEKILNVIIDKPHEGMYIIDKLSNCKHVALFGEGLHVVVDDSLKAQNDIQNALTNAGYPITLLEEIAPSLEDVFVSLIEETDRAEMKNGISQQKREFSA